MVIRPIGQQEFSDLLSDLQLLAWIDARGFQPVDLLDPGDRGSESAGDLPQRVASLDLVSCGQPQRRNVKKQDAPYEDGYAVTRHV